MHIVKHLLQYLAHCVAQKILSFDSVGSISTGKVLFII